MILFLIISALISIFLSQIVDAEVAFINGEIISVWSINDSLPGKQFPLLELFRFLNSNVLSKIKFCKAFGPDSTPIIIWKDRSFHILLRKLCSLAFEENVCTSHWLKSNIIPVPKKRDLSLATNYRGISFHPITVKIYTYLTSFEQNPTPH